MNRKIKAFLSLFLCIILTGTLVAESFPCTAYAVTQDDLKELKNKRDQIKAQRQEKQSIVEALEEEKASVVEQKQAMDERNAFTLMQMQLNNEEIELYNSMIAEKEKELTTAQLLEEEQLERYRTRIRAMEENGTTGYLALILRTNNLGEMLTMIDDIGEIMQSDKRLEDKYIAARMHTEEVKEDYEEYRADINAKQNVLRSEQKELEKEIEEATNLITELENNIEQRQAEYEAIMVAEDQANAAVDAMVAKLEEQRRAALAAQVSSGAAGNGSFVWPVASYVYVSSRFGLRVHPITGKEKSHTGMDIASNQGTAVYAADGGVVSLAAWNGGYGNCIIIDHGNGYVTLYGHLSSMAVSENSVVNQGSTIGYVGSTGNSTGPHLHFEVLKNGTRIDPEQFYSGLAFSADAGE